MTEYSIWQGFACHYQMMVKIVLVKMIWNDNFSHKMILDDDWTVKLTRICDQYDCIFPVILNDKSCHWTHSFFPAMTRKKLSSRQVCDGPGFSVWPNCLSLFLWLVEPKLSWFLRFCYITTMKSTVEPLYNKAPH